ncbi:class I SAM-dependent methyltransferase [Pseudoflavitalea sp. G-6-1-2]|uniref:class I SAM-dependent methyltransferase n=1 Tax=Pseudoflavitalea sp. G-6-1-2 TaxID=2728841 RepID=UPI00146A2C41|nr:class I SAM-dependent methyltransferase [Pseudoflavitalea sp. G-6-1-2]NML20856.1 class I SAM-dependent methyltransferase [Pseudoflavitalea sp. G-6-1-2]
MIQEIANYWDRQSAIWAEEKNEAWSLPETRYWMEYFMSIRSQLNGNKVLELGTASGYFAHILTLAGYEVTAIDLSPNMIDEAKRVAQQLNAKVDYHVMNAQELSFADNQFDLIFTRIMTWGIPDLQKCYSESFRVLKPGGLFLNFDGDFGEYQFSQEGHEKYPADIMEQANSIKAQLDISRHRRPAKDIEVLQQVGFENVFADATAQSILLHKEEDSTIFKVQAAKPQ